LLLEKLQPAQPNSEALHAAANSRRVLAMLGPAGFVPALIEMVRSENSIGRAHAIPLLGQSGHGEAGRFLETTLPTLPKSLTATAVRALHKLERRGATAKVAELLDTTDADLRGACLAFLTDLGDGSHDQAVLRALGNETQDDLIPRYLAYLRQHAVGEEAAAETLLGLLGSGNLIPPRQTDVVRALATIAPKGHEPTCDKLRALIAAGEVRALGRACAATMLALGDKSGRTELFDGLDADVRKSPKVPPVLANRGEALFEFEKWNEAIRDFKDAQRLSRSTMTREFALWIARCYVRQSQARKAVTTLREANVGRLEIAEHAALDPVFKAALEENSDLRGYVRDLNR
jgi:hypothetical protein